MKKHITGLLLLSSCFSFAFAQGVDTDPSSSQAQCTILSSTNLRLRARDVNTNGEVSLLQGFLQDQGLLSSDPTGYFGTVTLAAVNAFQSRSGITPPTGYVGPLTRAKIQEVSCGSTSTPSNGNRPVITVTRTNPNIQPGQTQTLSWSTANATTLTAFCAGAGANANKTISLPLQQQPFVTTWAEYRAQGSTGIYMCTWTATGPGGVTTYQETSSVAPDGTTGGTVACPMDAMVCPNGTTVGRTGLSCTFAPCPVTAVPVITGVIATPAASTLVVTGTNLSGANLRVSLSGTLLGIISSSDTQLVATLPQVYMMTGQSYSVYVTNERGTSNTMVVTIPTTTTTTTTTTAGAPTVTASVVPTAIPSGGTFSQLTYSSTNAVYCDWSKNGTLVASRVAPSFTWDASTSGGPYTQTTTWSFVCYNQAGQASAPVSVTMTVTPTATASGMYSFAAGDQATCNGNIVTRFGSQVATCTIGGACGVTCGMPGASCPSSNPTLWGACVNSTGSYGSSSGLPQVASQAAKLQVGSVGTTVGVDAVYSCPTTSSATRMCLVKYIEVSVVNGTNPYFIVGGVSVPMVQNQEIPTRYRITLGTLAIAPGSTIPFRVVATVSGGQGASFKLEAMPSTVFELDETPSTVGATPDVNFFSPNSCNTFAEPSGC